MRGHVKIRLAPGYSIPRTTFGHVRVAFDHEGYAVSDVTHGRELPPECAEFAAPYPTAFIVEHGAHAAPVILPPAHLRTTNKRPPRERPTMDELLSEGLPPADAHAIHVYEGHRQRLGVWPYGGRSPTEEMIATLSTLSTVAPATTAPPPSAAASARPSAAAQPPEEAERPAPAALPPRPPTHYEARREELTAVAHRVDNGRGIREIARRYGLKGATKKQEMIAAILRHEFPDQEVDGAE